MIPKYHEASQEVELHSRKHNVCTPEHQAELDSGWECSCTDCQCDTVIKIQAAYDWVEDHKVIINVNPGQYHGNAAIALTPERARALASLLMFAANDADTLNKEFPV